MHKLHGMCLKPTMKLIEQSQISPPVGSVPESSLPLTFFDILLLDLGPVRRCLFFDFPHSTSQFTSFHLPNLKSSLSLTLQNFFPLAGKIRLSPDSNTQFEIHYSTNDSIMLTVSESELNFLELVGSHVHDSSKLSPLVPELVDSKTGKSLLAIQITIFPNQGTVIAFTIDHVACDGSSYTHFIKSWANACCSPVFSPLPSFDRTGIVANFQDYYLHAVKYREEHISKELPIETSGFSTESDSITSIFSLGVEQISNLKKHFRAMTQNASLHCSTFVVSSAYLWVCLVKLRQYPADKMVYFLITADFRRRLKPPMPSTYFGNGIFVSFVEMMAGDLVKDDGVVVASEAIGKVIGELDDDVFKIIERTMEKSRRAMVSGSLFTIVGSPKFGLYGVDFGWGRPVRVEICMENGGVFMGDSREEDGGVEIGVVLARHEMEEFSAIYAEGLKCL